MKNIASLFVSLILFTGEAFAYEFVIFKRIHEDLNITSLPYPHTVWHIDALNLVKYRIEGPAVEVPVGERVEFMQSILDELSPRYIEALLLMGYAGTEKMKGFGLSETPAAVLLDNDGKVVQSWNGIEDGNVLLNREDKP